MTQPHRSTASSSALGDPVLTFMQVLWRVEHGLERASKRMEDALGVSGPQRLALRLIGVLPDIGPVELAGALHLHPSTVTGVLQRLETRGLVRRVRHESDGRRVHLRVTRAGARLNSPRAKGTVEGAVRTTLARCDENTRRAAVELLDQLSARLMTL